MKLLIQIIWHIKFETKYNNKVLYFIDEFKRWDSNISQ
jgi:hypothetical protein